MAARSDATALSAPTPPSRLHALPTDVLLNVSAFCLVPPTVSRRALLSDEALWRFLVAPWLRSITTTASDAFSERRDAGIYAVEAEYLVRLGRLVECEPSDVEERNELQRLSKAVAKAMFRVKATAEAAERRVQSMRHTYALAESLRATPDSAQLRLFLHVYARRPCVGSSLFVRLRSADDDDGHDADDSRPAVADSSRLERAVDGDDKRERKREEEEEEQQQPNDDEEVNDGKRQSAQSIMHVTPFGTWLEKARQNGTRSSLLKQQQHQRPQSKFACRYPTSNEVEGFLCAFEAGGLCHPAALDILRRDACETVGDAATSARMSTLIVAAAASRSVAAVRCLRDLMARAHVARRFAVSARTLLHVLACGIDVYAAFVCVLNALGPNRVAVEYRPDRRGQPYQRLLWRRSALTGRLRAVDADRLARSNKLAAAAAEKKAGGGSGGGGGQSGGVPAVGNESDDAKRNGRRRSSAAALSPSSSFVSTSTSSSSSSSSSSSWRPEITIDEWPQEPAFCASSIARFLVRIERRSRGKPWAGSPNGERASPSAESASHDSDARTAKQRAPETAAADVERANAIGRRGKDDEPDGGEEEEEQEKEEKEGGVHTAATDDAETRASDQDGRDGDEDDSGGSDEIRRLRALKHRMAPWAAPSPGTHRERQSDEDARVLRYLVFTQPECFGVHQMLVVWRIAPQVVAEAFACADLVAMLGSAAVPEHDWRLTVGAAGADDARFFELYGGRDEDRPTGGSGDDDDDDSGAAAAVSGAMRKRACRYSRAATVAYLRAELYNERWHQVRRHTRSHPTRIRALVTAIDPRMTSFGEYVGGSPNANSVMRLQVLAVLLDLAAEQRGRLAHLGKTLRPLWSSAPDDDRRYRPKPRMRVSMVWRRDAALMASLAERYPRVVDQLSATTVFMEPRSKRRRPPASATPSVHRPSSSSAAAPAPSLSSSGVRSTVSLVDDRRCDDDDDDDAYTKPYGDEDDLRIELSSDSEHDEEEDEVDEEEDDDDEREKSGDDERTTTEEKDGESETADPEPER